MKTWQDLFDQKMPKDYSDRVLRAAEAEMTKAADEKAKLPKFLSSRWSFVGGFAAAVLALVFLKNQDVRPRGDDMDMLGHDGEMLKDMDFFSELDTLEAWEEIEAEEKGDK